MRVQLECVGGAWDGLYLTCTTEPGYKMTFTHEHYYVVTWIDGTPKLVYRR